MKNKIITDENGEAIDVVLRERGTGEKLIEDFMIAANETVARHITYMEYPFIYRIHGEPNEEKINNFLNFLTFGFIIFLCAVVITLILNFIFLKKDFIELCIFLKKILLRKLK